MRFFIALAFVLTSNAILAQGAPLTDFTVELRWTSIVNDEAIKESSSYRTYEGGRLYTHICSRETYEKLKFGADQKVLASVSKQLQDYRASENPGLEGCVNISTKFVRTNALGGKFENPADWAPSVYQISMVEFYTRAVRELKVQKLSDVVFVLSFWRVGNNIVNPDIIELVGIKSLDLLEASLTGNPAATMEVESNILPKSETAKAQLEASFSIAHVPTSSPFYDLNVPGEIFRPSIIRRLSGRETKTIILRDILNASVLYYSFQKDPIWSSLTEKLSLVDLKSKALTDFLANDRVSRTLSMKPEESLDIYLYYYRLNLEDVELRSASLQKTLRDNPQNFVLVDNQLVMTTQAQEALARYELIQRQTRDAVVLFDLVSSAGRAYLDQILR